LVSEDENQQAESRTSLAPRQSEGRREITTFKHKGWVRDPAGEKSSLRANLKKRIIHHSSAPPTKTLAETAWKRSLGKGGSLAGVYWRKARLKKKRSPRQIGSQESMPDKKGVTV